MLSDLDKRDYDVVLLQSASDKMKMYVQDKLKAKYQSTRDTIIDVVTNSDLKVVREVSGLLPPFSEKWLVFVTISRKLSMKDVIHAIDNSTTCTFVICTQRYKEFKDLKEALKKKHTIIEQYLAYLRREDFVYLYDALVPKKYQMQKVLFDYLVQGYSADIESVFDLFIALNGGKKVKTRKDIADICGIGGLTIDSFVFSLLRKPSESEKGLKRIMHNRILAGEELIQVYGLSKFYNYTRACLYNLVQVKMLKDTGVIYKTIRNLPDGYDQMKLVRYQKYMWSLSEIPLSRILRLYSCMSNKCWRTDLDFLKFMYEYFTRSYSDGTINLKDVKGGKGNAISKS